ncbi:MAG: pyridoxal phosphate-dependent aminotransferase [Bifidobacteriaceae bacterium]|nr:pyridoxal phosphate-dependent aminotransferase [Bifidobacteriaceae bacterium]
MAEVKSNGRPAGLPRGPEGGAGGAGPRLSRRFAGGACPNDVALTRADLEAAGVRLTDLTDSNPTHYGLGDQRALDAVARAASRATVYAPDPRGPMVAREALAARYGGSPWDYWLTASTSEAYSWVFAALTDPGDAIAIPSPGYPLIEPLAALSSVRTVTYPWHYLHPYGWWADTGVITGLADREDLRAFVLVNPENPAGVYTDDATADAVVATCQRAGAALISDEVFGPFALDGEPASLAGDDRAVTFALGGLSKTLCAPQLKLAWLRLSGPRGALGSVREVLDQIADTYLSVGTPVAMALPELLDLSDDVARVTRARLAGNLATARRILGEAPYRVRRCEGGWTAIVDVPRYLPDGDLAIYLMREAHLAVHPGWFYDVPDSGTLALSLLPEPADFETRCRHLRTAVDTLGGTLG